MNTKMIFTIIAISAIFVATSCNKDEEKEEIVPTYWETYEDSLPSLNEAVRLSEDTIKKLFLQEVIGQEFIQITDSIVNGVIYQHPEPIEVTTARQFVKIDNLVVENIRRIILQFGELRLAAANEAKKPKVLFPVDGKVFAREMENDTVTVINILKGLNNLGTTPNQRIIQIGIDAEDKLSEAYKDYYNFIRDEYYSGKK